MLRKAIQNFKIILASCGGGSFLFGLTFFVSAWFASGVYQVGSGCCFDVLRCFLRSLWMQCISIWMVIKWMMWWRFVWMCGWIYLTFISVASWNLNALFPKCVPSKWLCFTCKDGQCSFSRGAALFCKAFFSTKPTDFYRSRCQIMWIGFIVPTYMWNSLFC